MIEKVRNAIDNDKVGTSTSTFTSKYNNSSVEVEDFDLDSNLGGKSEITEEMAFDAIKKSFANNREVTKNMNNEVYNALKNRIDDYIANNGVDDK